MFSTKIIRQNLDRIERAQGIKLTEYSVEKSIQVYEYFLSIAKTDGKRSWYQREEETEEQFTYAQWEKDWIQNELFYCACSFPYWFFRYFFLKTKDGRITRPEVLAAHLVFMEILADLDEQQLPIILFCLKARQLGVSTLIEAIILWIAMFRRGSHCVIASAEEEKSIDMSGMVWTGLDNLPLWMKPILTAESKQKGPVFGELASDILIQHGAMTKGISRGSTPHAAHVSEVSWFNDPVQTIESSLLKAMHENPRTFLVLESTAKKKDDWFHQTWKYNREAEKTGRNKFTCLFLPWYVGHDKYPTKDWIRNHPIPEGWEPRKGTIDQSIRAALYVATTPLLKKHMGAGWKMPIEQQWFWEFSYDEASRSEQSLRSFYAEMASDEISAFQSKKTDAFSIETIERLRSEISSDFTDYAIIGDGIDKRFHLREYWSSKRHIPIDWITMDGQPRHWELVPLKSSPSEDTEDFFVRIWHHPQRGFSYTIPIDPSGGVGGDHSALEVMRVGKLNEPDIQVAQIYSRWLPAAEIPPFAQALGVYYGRMMEPIPEAYMCPETQMATGDFTVHQLTKEGYTNIHRMRRYDMAPKSGSIPNRLGWATGSWSRPMITETMKMALDYGWVKILSERTVEEIEGLETDEADNGKLKYDHSTSSYSDSYIALCIGHWCSHDEETLAARKAGKRPRKSTDESANDNPKILNTPEGIMAAEISREERMALEPTEDEMNYIY